MSGSKRSFSPTSLLSIPTAVCTLLLIVAGGLVTSHDAALAVPDWPTSFGYNMFLFPWSKMVGGIFYEHTHRLLGSLVGILCILLLIVLYKTNHPQWIRKLGGFALMAVILQGVLGGLRVELIFKPIAIVHALLAQLIFCLICVITLVTSPFWKSLEIQNSNILPDPSLRKIALITTATLLVQLLLGAVMRHTDSGLAIPDFPTMYRQWIPPLSDARLAQINEERVWIWNLDRISRMQVLIHLAHRLWAFVVAFWIIALAYRSFQFSSKWKPARKLAILLSSCLIVQFGLGIMVIWSQKAADIATAHVALGAVTLMTSTLMTCLYFKLHRYEPAGTIYGEVAT